MTVRHCSDHIRAGALAGSEQKNTIPQFVFVGQQASGKTSVLNAILSDLNFPINSRYGTQFPIEIFSRCTSSDTCKARIILSGPVNISMDRTVNDFSQRWKNITDEHTFADVIEDATRVMELDQIHTISSHKLRIECSSPHNDNINLIDLPGLFDRRLSDGIDSDAKRVGEIVTEYIRQPQTTILAIISGAYDLQDQRVLYFMKPYSDRTLGIVTAPDRVLPGSKRDKEFARLITNCPYRASYGWHVVKNLTTSEERRGNHRWTVERQFFHNASETGNFWMNAPVTCRGVEYLRCTLAALKHTQDPTQLYPMVNELRGILSKSEEEFKYFVDNKYTTSQRGDEPQDTRQELEDESFQQYLPNRIMLDLPCSYLENHTGRLGHDSGYPTPRAMSPLLRHESVERPVKTLQNCPRAAVESHSHASSGQDQPGWAQDMLHQQERMWKDFSEKYAESTLFLLEQFFIGTIERVVGEVDALKLFRRIESKLIDRCELANGILPDVPLLPTESPSTPERRTDHDQRRIQSPTACQNPITYRQVQKFGHAQAKPGGAAIFGRPEDWEQNLLR